MAPMKLVSGAACILALALTSIPMPAEAQARGRSAPPRSPSARAAQPANRAVPRHPTGGRRVGRAGGPSSRSRAVARPRSGVVTRGPRVAPRGRVTTRPYVGGRYARPYVGRPYRSYRSYRSYRPYVYRSYGYRPYYRTYRSYPYYGYGYRSYGYPYGYRYRYYSPISFGFHIGYGLGAFPIYPYPAYGYPAYGYSTYGSGYADLGGIRLQVEPEEATVYVDGYYVGIVDDFDGTFQRLELEPGPHRIEIHAPGYAPLVFEINIVPGQTIRYRGRLVPAYP